MVNQSLRVLYKHTPITTPNTGNAAARRITFTDDGRGSGKVWVQSSVTIWVKFDGGSVDATGGNNAHHEIELMAGGPQPVLDTQGKTHMSVWAASDARVVIQEVA